PPGGESFAAMIGRVAGALENLTAAQAGRDILAIVHAGTVRAALATALDISPAQALRFSVHPLSLTRLDATSDGWRVEMVNVLPYS
ncbi:MAG: histidine phosphatase family protein, partial [Magnetospirillum sp.]